jgi:single-stranded-DNA-specific exonuclease
MSSYVAAGAPWHIRESDPQRALELARRHSVSSVVATLLASRGLTDEDAIERHLTPRMTDLHDPALLPGMQAATERILQAVRDKETILVHGDYDVDGVTGTTLLMRLFEEIGAKACWHIPNRFTDGYSFGAHSIARAEDAGATLVISVDNGTSATETIRELKEHGIDTIVTDHHEPPLGDLPPAVAIVNPKLNDSTYPFRELCGGAVAFKLAWGVCKALTGEDRLPDKLKTFLLESMAYVAIATVCDVVPLIDENRILARFGLKSLGATQNPGLAALRSVCGLEDGPPPDAEDVAFQIGPRINASGRLGSAHYAVELLLSKDDETARGLAKTLDELNQERRRIERELLDEAYAAAEPYADAQEHPVLVVAGQGWHQGVVGIVAARLVERYERPAIVIGLDGAEGRGSARSVPGFSVLEVMHGGADHMQRYGGHEQAAGCEILAGKVDALRAALRTRAKELLGGGSMPAVPVRIDSELPFEEMTDTFMRELDRLKPFGERNEKPVFLSRDLRLAEHPRILGKTREHLALRLRRGEHVMRAMAFGRASREPEFVPGEPIDLVYTPRWNTFRGRTTLELQVIDFRTGAAAGAPAGTGTA